MKPYVILSEPEVQIFPEKKTLKGFMNSEKSVMQ